MKSLVLNLHDVFIVLTVVEAIFIALALWLVPSRQRQSRHLLAVLFLLLAGQIFGNLMLWSPGLQGLAVHSTVFIPLLFATCVMLQGPALYFYFVSLSRPLVFKPLMFAHITPLALVILLILSFDLIPLNFLPNPDLLGHQAMAADLVWSIIKCAPLAYVIACIVFEVRVRRQIKHIYSSIPKMENHLATIVLFGFFIYWSWSALGHVINPYLSYAVQDSLGIINNYLAALIVNTLLAFGFINARQSVHLAESKTTVLPDDKSEAIITQVEEAIANKIYLESDLNLERFAKVIASNPKHVSHVINHHYHSNFFEFINKYRVEEAKRLLVSTEHKHQTILEIVYLSGFNSQSAFHRFFKRLVNQTPSDFRQAHQSNNG
ncbi:HTH-type transcriptional regulator YesS [Thalassocella blandensis]|nr:HTH-type transcriptional regulator YesS [Thalassocella blandensis]